MQDSIKYNITIQNSRKIVHNNKKQLNTQTNKENVITIETTLHYNTENSGRDNILQNTKLVYIYIQ